MKKVIKRKVILFSLPFLLLLLPILAFFALFMGSVDSSSSDSDVIVNTTQQQVAKIIWDKALEEGATKEGAAALIGNNQHESGGLIPSAIQGQAPYDEAKAMDKSVDGYGFGLPQMDGGRRVNMLNYAKSQKKSWTDTKIQVEFMFEHDGTDSTLLKQLVKETNVKQATEDIMRKWERAGAVDSLSQRQEYAQYWYTFMTTGGGDSGTTGSGGSGITSDIPSGWKLDKPINTSGYIASSYEYKQCTWFTWNRAKEFGITFGMYMGNGAEWQKQAGYTVTTTPTLHSAVSFSGGQTVGGQWNADPQYGHVAFVEGVHSDGSVLISQSGTGFSTVYTFQVLTKEQASQLHYVIGK
ncbi:phage tail tip lysozyme [Lactococcus lactis]|jgi:surface antigen|uniref:phage tail tip lysozyme n=1 Tax=Lactococcus lactis TaxID=1358 RepID=UPI0020524121|nr:phage tail tip lysozyme [Lactococcus lactis]WKF73457.1 phage tail tip lysozyme [Lactococcus lactis]BDH80621.1 amidase [Lactococcus lactis]